ncbi:MAG: glycosyltransferase family 4 protein [Ignavibacteriaceae bacterium]
MKKILMILQSEFPPDIRLEKEIKSLAEAGYIIRVVCNQYRKNSLGHYQYCTIDRIKAVFNNTKFNKILNFPIFINPRFVIKIFKSILEFKPDFIHAHDLPMSPLGIFFGRLYRIPIILDMHENYPAALEAFQKKGVLNYIFKNYRTAKILEKYCIRKADRIITVVEENAARMVESGIAVQKVFVVSNTVDLETFATGAIDVNIVNKYKDKFVLLYTGFVSPERGLDTIVKGMEFLKDEFTNVLLLIVGNGISLPFLQNIVSQKKIGSLVEFIPWPGHENLGSYLEIAKVGISPQPRNEHWNNSIPHKLFEYMSQSKPVLVTDAIPLKRVIDETKAGLSFTSGNPKNFAEKITELINSEVNFGENGLKAVRDKYNWNKDAKVLINMYNELSDNKLNKNGF